MFFFSTNNKYELSSLKESNNSKVSLKYSLDIAPTSFFTISPFLIKKICNVKKGSAKGSKEVVGAMSQEQLRQIAEIKLPDLNCYSIEEAMKIVAGTAQNMGVKVED